MKIIDFRQAQCRHCYKCVRGCAVKAISVQNQQARILEELCIHCGRCLEVCPQNAKTFSSDLDKIKGYIRSGKRTVVSLAPSYLGVLPFQEPGQIADALVRLGFSAVRETAEGAACVTREYARLLGSGVYENMISTCCPSVNDLVEKYYPALVPFLAPVVSPMIAHGRLIKKIYGQDTKVVFLGPCIAKKKEAEDDPRVRGAVDAVFTFEGFLRWLKEEDLCLKDCANRPMDNPDPMVNRLYPIGGGILASVEAEAVKNGYDKVAVDGVKDCMELFETMMQGKLKNCFLEVNVCRGGCVKGPVSGKNKESHLTSTVEIQRRVSYREAFQADLSQVALKKEFQEQRVFWGKPREEELTRILQATGKFSPQDELNCGACGYSTCREKAAAVLEGKAELDMCLPYAVARAESMSNVVLDKTPSILFLTDSQLQILECSSKAQEVLKSSRGEILGRYLFEFLDSSHAEKVFSTRQNILNKRVQVEALQMTALETIVFIEDSHSLLVMYQDITQEEQNKEKALALKMEAVEMAQQVIDKQMTVAQEIAGLLGETTAQTKVTLTKLRDSILEGGEV